jgi:hypothetical protein
MEIVGVSGIVVLAWLLVLVHLAMKSSCLARMKVMFVANYNTKLNILNTHDRF